MATIGVRKDGDLLFLKNGGVAVSQGNRGATQYVRDTSVVTPSLRWFGG
jgi:hypothetical protein